MQENEKKIGRKKKKKLFQLRNFIFLFIFMVINYNIIDKHQIQTKRNFKYARKKYEG